mmetsp:Transcript_786/g.1687  ORF Transcript_786/g.1687 Transcript_786/m.1687 type:complete len:248 (+) Transcript_786:125-868(+)|eukprot:CAMPEP_0178422906 /NCGR_PEP_ID=MMETSP0689_2-20121128/27416_1 /TAXON_ID=160604 /ORGANISM="Amphidinium massartii, Strain CS-259" /LENGTH=247 /DNA_ID=CAMNT_0020044487 /DNA_START=55 /DNA_END=798 /DNA_ORIENTATION=+
MCSLRKVLLLACVVSAAAEDADLQSKSCPRPSQGQSYGNVLLQVGSRGSKAFLEEFEQHLSASCMDWSTWLAETIQTLQHHGQALEDVGQSDPIREKACACSAPADTQVRELMLQLCQPATPGTPMPKNCSEEGSWFLNGTCCEGFHRRWSWTSLGYTCEKRVCAEAKQEPVVLGKPVPCCNGTYPEMVQWSNGTSMLLCLEPLSTTTGASTTTVTTSTSSRSAPLSASQIPALLVLAQVIRHTLYR